MTRRVLVLSTLTLLGVLGLRSAAPASAGRNPGGSIPGDTISILGPTVVAYFAITQAEVDADDNAMEALSDFQYYLPAVESGLLACGVATVETYASRVVLLRGDTVDVLAPKEHDVQVGYRLVRPGRPALTIEGVHTDVDLLTAAVEYFELPEHCWRSGGSTA